METLRVYADTSVYGEVFDDEFESASRAFFDEVRNGRFRLVISASVEDEIAPAPEAIREFFDSLLVHAEVTNVTDEMYQLQDAYLDAGIVSARWSEDALPRGYSDDHGLFVVSKLEFQAHSPLSEDSPL